MKKTIGVVGLWHLGCVICASWSKLGNKVIGFDYDSSRVEKLNAGKMPIYEPNLAELIQEGMRSRKLSFSSNISSLAPCDFIFLSYDTPVSDDDTSDIAILEKSVKDIRNIMKRGSVLIVSSQSPAGFCSSLRLKLKEKNSSLELAYSPENLRLGDAIQCYLNPGRIILGIANSQTERKCKDLYSQIRANIYPMNIESAEMVKHGINSFLSMSIVFANQLADICESTGARIDDVIKGMKSDFRIGEKAYLSPGIGFSGGTLGRDLKVLDKINTETKGNAKLFEQIYKLNSERKFSIVNRIEKLLGIIHGTLIGILGVTYKPGTSTLRRSLPLEIINLLIDKKSTVKIFDPKADYTELSLMPRFTVVPNIEEASISADILVLLTEWEEFKDYDWKDIPQKMRRPIFFDTKNFLDEQIMRSSGFKYYSIGR